MKSIRKLFRTFVTTNSFDARFCTIVHERGPRLPRDADLEMGETEYRGILNRKWKSSGDTCFFRIYFSNHFICYPDLGTRVNKIWTNE